MSLRLRQRVLLDGVSLIVGTRPRVLVEDQSDLRARAAGRDLGIASGPHDFVLGFIPLRAYVRLPQVIEVLNDRQTHSAAERLAPFLRESAARRVANRTDFLQLHTGMVDLAESALLVVLLRLKVRELGSLAVTWLGDERVFLFVEDFAIGIAKAPAVLVLGVFIRLAVVEGHACSPVDEGPEALVLAYRDGRETVPHGIH